MKTAQTTNPNGSDYMMSSNLSTVYMEREWIELWQQIEIWYGDPKQRETAEQLINRLQVMYSLKRKAS